MVVFYLVSRELTGGGNCRCLTGPSRHGRTKKSGDNIVLDETVTRLWLLANGWEAKVSFIRGNREETGEPS